MPASITTTDPLIIELHSVIAKIVSRVLARPDWVLRDVSPIDRALIERVMQLAVLIEGGRHDVIH